MRESFRRHLMNGAEHRQAAADAQQHLRAAVGDMGWLLLLILAVCLLLLGIMNDLHSSNRGTFEGT